MRTGNKIRVALSISNMLFSIVISAGIFSGFFRPWISKSSSTTYVLYSLLIYTIVSCSWLSAGLSFFYFIKIVNFKTRFFLWVKKRISLIVSWIILVSEAMSLGSFLIILLSTVPWDFSKVSSNSTVMITSNNTISENTLRTRLAYLIMSVTLVPLLTIIFTSICIVVVLTQHSQKMQTNMRPSGNVKLTIYQDATHRMLRLLFFFVMFYAFLLFFFMTEFSESSPVFWICVMILSSFTAVQSLLLVLGNKKLKGAWKELFHCITDCKKVHV